MYGLRERLTRQQSLAFILDFREKMAFCKESFFGGAYAFTIVYVIDRSGHFVDLGIEICMETYIC